MIRNYRTLDLPANYDDRFLPQDSDPESFLSTLNSEKEGERG